ncbi:MAG: hypothetical protein OEV49_02835 [candidate division Zixibacteria bacterium]|nr:hypothetical protein [candidate division Zixibacteria bacterium]MDH3937422.1 hypothetical protein [candidate division Zixibacteria bacterium]MDH4034426.1 hypothetical protein [candidate division Zixibacteria bacterium]
MSNDTHKYEILRQLAMAGAAGEDVTYSAEAALKQAAELVGLSAAALYLWGKKGKPAVNVAFAETETEQEHLQSLEDDLFSALRNERQLESAYMSFAGDPPRHSFTLPLRYQGQVHGAVIGLQTGERTIVSENIFLEALSALLALNSAAAGLTQKLPTGRQALDQAKVEGIHQTAVTANHEINNALTPILGIANLLRTGPGVTPDMKEKLQKIESSADRIRSVLQRLMRVDKPDSVVYYDNIKMIPLPPEDERDDQ